ncbi:hypothetical protein DRH29_01295 [candidate division Kazan bacterium]|uniref:Uncharacterized protein n=1 Tax=candidate division Kazan bacterium TaxID=2202143 RepID=A0A420ZDI5_UNCK3|nr:MAG: hypothetical protein DRH29_01295 [candidate division Kazan bacterium]
MKKKNNPKIILAVIGLLIVAGLAGWQLYPRSVIMAEDRALVKQTNEHTYELLVKFEKPIYHSIIKSSVRAEIYLLEDGQPVSEIPEEFGSDLSPVHLNITPIESSAINREANSNDWKMMTYLRSPQAQSEWKFDYLNGTDTLSGTLGLAAKYTPVYNVYRREFTNGYAEFEYIYGNAMNVPDVLFEIEAVFLGGFGKIERIIRFDPPPLPNELVDAKVISAGDFYYDVEIIPTWQNTTYNLYYTFTELEKSKMWFEKKNLDEYYDQLVRNIPERVLKIKIISRDKATGEINTNPYQRVKVEMVPLFYVDAEDDTHFEFPGRLVGQYSRSVTAMPDYAADLGFTGLIETMQDVYLSGILNSRGESVRVFANGKPVVGYDPVHWFAYHSIPSGKHTDPFRRVQLDVDLVDGVGEVVFNPNLQYADANVITQRVIEDGGSEDMAQKIIRNAGINEAVKNKSMPQVIITIRPENYNLRGYSKCGHRLTSNTLKSIPTGSYREQAEICLPDKAASQRDSEFLYQKWMDDESIKERVYTAVALSPDDLLRSDVPIEPLAPKQVISWILILAVLSQVIQVIGGSVILIVQRRKQKRNKL